MILRIKQFFLLNKKKIFLIILNIDDLLYTSLHFLTKNFEQRNKFFFVESILLRWQNNSQKRSTPCIASPYIFTYIIAGKGFLWNSGVPRGWVLVGLAWCASERKDGISVSREEKGAKGREKEWRDAESGFEAAQMMEEWKETDFSAVKACFSPFFLPLAYIFRCSGKYSL